MATGMLLSAARVTLAINSPGDRTLSKRQLLALKDDFDHKAEGEAMP
jgi:hypothetical protein